MGKRKSSSKAAPKKKQEPLSTAFRCLFCHHDKTVLVKLDRAAGKGYLKCKDCGIEFETLINALSVHVDVYSDWVDAAEEQKERAPAPKPARQPNPLNHGSAGGARLTMQSSHANKSTKVGEGLLDDDDDEDEEDGEADYRAPSRSRPNGKGSEGGKGGRGSRSDDDADADEDASDGQEEQDERDRRKKVRRADPDDYSD